MGYPKTLAEYLNIMKKIHNIYGQQYFMNLVSNDDYLSKYRNFAVIFNLVQATLCKQPIRIHEYTV